MFKGFKDLEGTFPGTLLTKNTSDVPTDADALPAFRVYDEDGDLVTTGTCSLQDSSNTNGFYRWTVACLSADGFESKHLYTVHFAWLMSSGSPRAETQTFIVT